MKPIEIYIETGKRRTFAVALNWPGWARWGKGEAAALENLLEHGGRYAEVPDAPDTPNSHA